MSEEKAIAERKALVAELMAQDRSKLLLAQPFLGGLLMRLDLVPVHDRRLDTASTDGDHIYADIDFYGSLDEEERVFVIAHEAWHCALMHFIRLQTRNQALFNVAADLEIHFILVDSGLRAPFVLPHDRSWKGLSAEEIYERLQSEGGSLPQNGGDSKKGKDAVPGTESKHLRRRGDGSGFDRHSAGNGVGGMTEFPSLPGRGEIGFDSDYSPAIKEGVQERTRERLTAMMQQCQRYWGPMPGWLEDIVKAILKPEINWKELLAQFVTNCYGGGRRWLPPARRHVWKGLYLQSQRQERLRATVAIDTSGSTYDDLPKFFSELTGILNSFGGYELTVIQCDAAVGKVEKFDDGNPLAPDHEWNIAGIGGTDFRPVFEYLETHTECDPNLLIYFTDGFGPAPDRAPSYPVMWLLTGDGREPAEWGTAVRFKNPRGGEA